jgi:CheY-like chemotaxis protein
MNDPSTTKSIRVLVVDDEPAVLNLVTRVLGQAGYDTVSAPDGPSALTVAQRSGPFDLLLTDVMMPDMTGDEVARKLREAEPMLKVLYLTAYSDHLFKTKVTLWEGEAFLDKPCSVHGLLEAVSLLLFGRVDPPVEAGLSIGPSRDPRRR